MMQYYLVEEVVHLWFLRKPSSRIGILLNMKISDLEKVIYYTKYVVTDNLKDRAEVCSFVEKGMLLKEEEFDLFKYGISSPVVKEEFKNIFDGIVSEEVVLEEGQNKALKQLKSLVKHQSDHFGMSADEAAKKIAANIEKGDTYYKCYFKSHCVYFYGDLDSSQRGEIKKILSDNFEKGETVSISEPDKKIRIEFFDIEKDTKFNELRKNPEMLKKYEGHLRIEISRNDIPFMRNFAKPENFVLLEESDIKNIHNGFGDNLKVDIDGLLI